MYVKEVMAILFLALVALTGCQNNESTRSQIDDVREKIDNQEYQSALEILDRELQNDTGNAELLELRGIALLELGKAGKAIEDFQKALTQEPDNVDLKVNLAAARIEDGQFSEALAELNAVLKQDSDDADAYRNRALAHLHLGKHNEAISDYTLAMALYGDIDETLHAERARCWKALGNERQAEIDQKIADATARLGENPEDLDAIKTRAIMLYELGNYQLAMFDFDDWIEQDSSASEAFLARGNCLYILENLDEALEDLNHAIQLNSNNPSAYLTRAHIYQQKSEERSALEDMESALELDSADPVIQSELAWLMLASKDKTIRDHDKALKLATAAVKSTDGKSWNELAVLARALAAHGQYREAVVHQTSALQLAPESQKQKLRKSLDIYTSEKSN